MINMKVVVKKKVNKTYTQEEMDAVCQLYIVRLDSLMNELTDEKRNHNLANAAVIAWQRKAEEYLADARNWQSQFATLSQKKQESDDLGMKAATDLAARLVKALDEADAARAEADELRVELMERQARIDELERRVQWLEAHSNTEAEFID